MKIALLADLHLPDSERTVKEEVLDWALSAAVRLGADRIVGAGDLTATGTVRAAGRLRRRLESTGIPFLLTPGNAELRTPVERARSGTFCGLRSRMTGSCCSTPPGGGCRRRRAHCWSVRFRRACSP